MEGRRVPFLSSVLPLLPCYPQLSFSIDLLPGNFFTNASDFSYLVHFPLVSTTFPEMEPQAFISQSGLDSRRCHT